MLNAKDMYSVGQKAIKDQIVAMNYQCPSPLDANMPHEWIGAEQLDSVGYPKHEFARIIRTILGNMPAYRRHIPGGRPAPIDGTRGRHLLYLDGF